ncbi:MAG: hypothetical protein LBT15_03305 [Synergistaceae bacterium]|jgi:hypothetical protein|nr:hypothetical protein [Synergistaceae bacterium]
MIDESGFAALARQLFGNGAIFSKSIWDVSADFSACSRLQSSQRLFGPDLEGRNPVVLQIVPRREPGDAHAALMSGCVQTGVFAISTLFQLWAFNFK